MIILCVHTITIINSSVIYINNLTHARSHKSLNLDIQIIPDGWMDGCLRAIKTEEVSSRWTSE